MHMGFGPAGELPTSSQARWRHGGCRSAGVAMQLLARPPRRFGFGTRNWPHDVRSVGRTGIRNAR